MVDSSAIQNHFRALNFIYLILLALIPPSTAFVLPSGTISPRNFDSFPTNSTPAHITSIQSFFESEFTPTAAAPATTTEFELQEGEAYILHLLNRHKQWHKVTATVGTAKPTATRVIPDDSYNYHLLQYYADELEEQEAGTRHRNHQHKFGDMVIVGIACALLGGAILLPLLYLRLSDLWDWYKKKRDEKKQERENRRLEEERELAEIARARQREERRQKMVDREWEGMYAQ